jgi:hypothetical protein
VQHGSVLINAIKRVFGYSEMRGIDTGNFPGGISLRQNIFIIIG